VAFESHSVSEESRCTSFFYKVRELQEVSFVFVTRRRCLGATMHIVSPIRSKEGAAHKSGWGLHKARWGSRRHSSH
jgi:hypothetical protein